MTDYGYGQTKEWVNRMWDDPWFVNLINRRYNELLDAGIVDYLQAKVDSISDLIASSQELNYQMWGINNRMYNEIVLYSSYKRYVMDLKSFITKRSEWLKSAFANKKLTEPTPPFEALDYYYRITNVNTAKAVDVIDGSVVQITNIASRKSQDWYIKPVGDYFQLINRSNDKALNDPTVGSVGPTTNVGAMLNVAIANEKDSRQLWSFVPQGKSGYYNLLNKHSQHIANLDGGDDEDYTAILSYLNDNRNGESMNRLWYITPGEELPGNLAGICKVEPIDYALAYNQQLHRLHFGSETPEQLTFNVCVYNVDGVKVADFIASDGYDMSALPAGVYVVIWNVEGNTRSVKFKK